MTKEYKGYLFAVEIYRKNGQLKENLAHRHILPVPRFVFTAQERQAYERLYESDDEEDLVDGEFLLKNRTAADLRWEQDHLKLMLSDLADLEGTSSNMQHLLRVLDRRMDQPQGRIKQTVIFTRFYDTLTDIVKHLQDANPQMLIGTHSGQGGAYFDPGTGRMQYVEREAVKERFLRGEIDVLVFTDAAAEGLNLQTADLLVNYDLGWNPMKVEQRIGRIDRIGQKHPDINVLKLCYADSAGSHNGWKSILRTSMKSICASSKRGSNQLYL